MSTAHRFAFAACAIALAACTPKNETDTSSTAATTSVDGAPPAGQAADAGGGATGCNVRVEKMWIDQETPIRRYSSEASTMGPTCDQAVVTLVVRAREGSPIFAWAGRTQDLFGLKDATDAAAMKTALGDWIDQDNSSLKTTENLPPWEETEGQPKRSEFPFMPESWIDKPTWDDMKKEKLDMFCFPQGGESLACNVLRDGQLEPIGVQLFPG